MDSPRGSAAAGAGGEGAGQRGADAGARDRGGRDGGDGVGRAGDAVAARRRRSQHAPTQRARRAAVRRDRRRRAATSASLPMPSSSARPPACAVCASTSRSIRPRSITTMRSATSRTRSRFCSTTTSDSLSRLRRPARISPISWTIDGWMPSDGSSSRSSHGAGNERAAEREDLLLAARERAALAVEERARGAAACRRCARSPPARCRPNRRSTRGAGSRARSAPAGCRAPAARSRCRAGCGRAPSSASRRCRRSRCGRRVVGTRPISVFRNVVLPTPLWPTMPTASPACSCEVDAVQDRHVAVGGAQAGDVEDDVARDARVGAVASARSPRRRRRTVCALIWRGSRCRPRAPSASASTSSTGPSRRIAPWCITVTLPPSMRTNCMSWSTTTTVAFWLTSWMMRTSWSASAPVMPAAGSSSSSSQGRCARTRPISTSWRWPCASSPTRRRAIALERHLLHHLGDGRPGSARACRRGAPTATGSPRP